MVDNKADIVENYIRNQLAGKQDGWIELSRTELADKISCAPSQISYVLSTRFTHERGFRVESRRGLGGYIRVTIIEDPNLQKNFMFKSMLNRIEEDTPFEVVRTFLAELLSKKFITRREAEIVAQTILNLYRSEASDQMSSAERAKLTRSIFVTLADIA